MWIQGTQQGSVKTYKLAVHEAVKYYCTQCEYRRRYLSKIKQHKLAVHEGNSTARSWSPNTCDQSSTKMRNN